MTFDQNSVTQIDSSPESYPSFLSVPPSIYELAQQQGVSAVSKVDSLLADFWPENDSIEEFAATVRRWRREES